MRKLLSALIALCLFATAANSYATVHVVTNTPITLEINASYETAMLVVASNNILYNGSTFVPDPTCGNQVYIPQSEHDMIAMAMTAAASGKNVTITWDDSGTSAATYYSGYIPCRIVVLQFS